MKFIKLINPVLKFFVISTMLIIITPQHLQSQQQGEPPMSPVYPHDTYQQLHEQQIAYAPDSQPFGSSYASWCQAWVKHIYSVPCAENPLISSTNDQTEPDQEGPVYFLSGTLGGTIQRKVTIPQGKGIFFPVLNYVSTYPCPYAGYKPAPGQSLKDFLAANAASMVDQGMGMSVSVDGQRISDLEPYRVKSELFYFKTLPEQTCLDPCVTGELQPALADGYWIMLNPLSAGNHTLHYRGSYPKLGWVVDVTYLIEVK